MRIMVTGAAGFIGSHLANHYAEQGHEVIGIDNFSTGNQFEIDNRVKIYGADIRDRSMVKDVMHTAKPDLVNHHAAQIDPRISMEDPIGDTMSNYVGTINVVDCACEEGCDKFIFASSCAVYGDIGATGMMIEGQFELPNCPYGISKLASEKYIRLSHRFKEISATILRYPNVYGPDQSGTRSTGVIAIFAYAMARGLPITIYGDGTARYQYCFIDDILAANDAALKRMDVDISTFTLANIVGRMASVNDLATMISAHFPGYEMRVNYGKPRDGEQYAITMRGDSAAESLNWKPKISLQEGIARVVEAAKEKEASARSTSD